MKVVIDRMAWLPADELSGYQIEMMKDRLTLVPQFIPGYEKENAKPVEMFRDLIDEKGLFGIPREFYRANKIRENEEIIQVSTGAPIELETRMRFDPPFDYQGEYVEKLVSFFRNNPYGGQIFQADTGCGKTAMGVEVARRVGYRTLILVHKDYFLDQWREEIQQWIPDARVGVIKQDRLEYEEHDFVIGMLHTLHSRADSLPDDLYSAFGTILSDECHRTGSSTWAPVNLRFRARNFMGLTATPTRKDQMESVFFWGIGPIRLQATAKSMVPDVVIEKSPVKLVAEERKSKRGSGTYTLTPDRMKGAQVISNLANNQERTAGITELVWNALKNGRKVMVVSERISQLRDMEKILEENVSLYESGDHPFSIRVGLCVAEYRDENNKKIKLSPEALEQAKQSNCLLATKQLIAEGFNVPSIDVVVLATPMGDIHQTVGRGRRFCSPSESKCARFCSWRKGVCKGKPTPIVLDVYDIAVNQVQGRYRTRRKWYKELGCIVHERNS